MQRAADLIPRDGRLGPIVAEVIAEVRETVRFEHAHSLKPWSRADALKPWFGPLDDFGWSPPEKAGIESMLEQGEKPTAVDFRAMTTNRRTINAPTCVNTHSGSARAGKLTYPAASGLRIFWPNADFQRTSKSTNSSARRSARRRKPRGRDPISRDQA